VTVGFLVAGRLPARRLPPYVLSQLVGALIAAGLLRLLFPEHASLGLTAPAEGATLLQCFLLEVVLSFLLMAVILNVSTGAMEKGIMAGAAIGATVCLEAMFAGPICGASMNPARSLAPAAVAGRVGDLWLYLTAPVLGAVLASPLCRIIQGPECCTVPPEQRV
jgi:aquaporin Z